MSDAQRRLALLVLCVGLHTSVTTLFAAPGKTAGQAGTTASAPQAVSSSNEYVIGPGDVLAINVWKEPEISRVVPVRPDGQISLPLMGDLGATGLTPLKLQAKITEKLKAYIANPEVTVIVQEVHSQKFNIVGGVSKPGNYPLMKPMRVLDAIAVAGGFQEFAKTKKIYVLRTKPDGSQQRIPFNYKAVIAGKNLSQNVELEPGDTVVVP
jgi:polysaccharide export outer membrane protein